MDKKTLAVLNSANRKKDDAIASVFWHIASEYDIDVQSPEQLVDILWDNSALASIVSYLDSKRGNGDARRVKIDVYIERPQESINAIFEDYGAPASESLPKTGEDDEKDDDEDEGGSGEYETMRAFATAMEVARCVLTGGHTMYVTPALMDGELKARITFIVKNGHLFILSEDSATPDNIELTIFPIEEPTAEPKTEGPFGF